MPTNQPQLNPQQQEYVNSVTPPASHKNKQMSTQSHLPFSEIREGIVIMRDSSLRSIVLCSPTNFDLKSPQEKDAVEFAYQGFLNGLHFPIQIVIQSRKIDLDNYLGKLEKIQSDQQNSLLASLMEDYIFNIKGLLEEVNIMEKRFFVVVPYYVATVSKQNLLTKLKGASADAEVSQTTVQFEQRKKDLQQRVAQVAQGLAQIGVRTAILNTQEVIELFYSSYNIVESQAQNLTQVEAMDSPAVLRGGQPPSIHGQTPKEVEPDDLYSAAQKQAPPTTAPPTNQTGAV